jgi:salicylate hydroxylase
VLHFHGGGYMIGSARASLDYAGRLVEAVQAPCLTLDYRLAPEHPFPAALDDALAAYRHLLARGHSGGDILLSGESSGGGLALALVAALRDAGEALPAGVIAMSPFTDLSLSGASIDAQAGRDPSATRAGLTSMAGAYVQRAEPTDPRISPLFADLRGFPPLLLQAAQNEGLRDDTTRFAERASAAGVDVTMRLYDDSVHVFALYGFLPESVQALEEVAAFARRRQG